jgi:hypothetical protein
MSASSSSTPRHCLPVMSSTKSGTALLLLAILLPCALIFYPRLRYSYRDLQIRKLNNMISKSGTMALSDLNDDVLLEICAALANLDALDKQYYISSGEKIKRPSALSDLSTTSRRFRSLAAPRLFKTVKVGGGWKKASKALGTLESCPDLLSHVRTFHFKVVIPYDRNASKQGPPPPSGLETQLVGALSMMPNLHTLHISVPEYHTDVFAEAFETAKLQMPNVTTLVLGCYCGFVANHTPNTTTLSSDGWAFLHTKRGAEANWAYSDLYNDGPADNILGGAGAAMNLIQAASKLPQLTYFEMDQWWRVSVLEQLHKHAPQISRLGMPGGRYFDSFEALLPTLAKFENLDELILASAANLKVGFEPPWCGNAYMGPGGEELARKVEKEGKEAEEMVARGVFGSLAGVKSLWVGDHNHAVCERNEKGIVTEVRWNELDMREKGRKSPSGWIV